MLIHTFAGKLVILIQWESESVVIFFLTSSYGTGFSHPRSHQARATFASEIQCVHGGMSQTAAFYYTDCSHVFMGLAEHFLSSLLESRHLGLSNSDYKFRIDRLLWWFE